MLLNRKQFTQTITLLSLVFFIGSLGGTFIGVFEGIDKREVQNSSVTTNQENQLKLQESGYLEVLKREPKNETALQGLVEVRLSTKDFKGAVTPLETLIQLHPEQASLKTLLSKIKSEMSK